MATIICIIVIIILIGIIQSAFSTPGRKTKFDADFITAGNVLSRWNHGYCLDGIHSTTTRDAYKNCIIYGQSGGFKSSSVLIPTAFQMAGHHSLIFNDPSTEVFQKVSGYFEKNEYEIKIINLLDVNISEGFNPLERVNSSSDIKRLSKMIITASLGKTSGDPFWSLSAEGLISLIVQLLVEYASKDYRSLFNVYQIISTMSHSPQKVDVLFVKCGNQMLLNEYKSYLSYGEKTLSSIIATCRTALSVFGTDSNIMKITSFDTIDFKSFKTKKVACFIHTSVADQKYFSVISSLFLQQFFNELMCQLPRKDDRSVFFLLDESSSLLFDNLDITIANIRKYNSGILQIYQSESQLISIHGPTAAKAIAENCYSKVYMGNQPLNISKELSELLGRFEFVDEKSGKKTIRHLLEPHEVHELSDSLIFVGSNRPIKTPSIPYFKRWRFSQYASLPPYQPSPKLPFQSPPLLPM